LRDAIPCPVLLSQGFRSVCGKRPRDTGEVGRRGGEDRRPKRLPAGGVCFVRDVERTHHLPRPYCPISSPQMFVDALLGSAFLDNERVKSRASKLLLPAREIMDSSGDGRAGEASPVARVLASENRASGSDLITARLRASFSSEDNSVEATKNKTVRKKSKPTPSKGNGKRLKNK